VVTTIQNFKFLAYPILEILPVGLLGPQALRFSKKPTGHCISYFVIDYIKLYHQGLSSFLSFKTKTVTIYTIVCFYLILLFHIYSDCPYLMTFDKHLLDLLEKPIEKKQQLNKNHLERNYVIAWKFRDILISQLFYAIFSCKFVALSWFSINATFCNILIFAYFNFWVFTTS